jgi:hypothetical protein
MDEDKILKAIDINLDKVESEGVAYYRLPIDLKMFLKKCNDKHGIIGFEYEADSWNFGVILGKNKQEKK